MCLQQWKTIQIIQHKEVFHLIYLRRAIAKLLCQMINIVLSNEKLICHSLMHEVLWKRNIFAEIMAQLI